MKTLILAAIRCLLMFTAVAALSVACPASVQADTTYVYTGNPFQIAPPPYTTNDFVTAMVTLASPLAANMPFTSVTPKFFSLSDGVQTITNLTATSFDFGFQSGSAGQIIHWSFFALVGSIAAATISSRNVLGFVDDSAYHNGANAITQSHPGKWTPSPVPDAGSSLALLSLSLTALGVAARQFKRAAA